jgi:hypothetical protein
MLLTVTPLPKYVFLSPGVTPQLSRDLRSMSCFDRRKFLTGGLIASTTVLFSEAAIAVCVDPEELSDSVQGMRDSLEYTEAAADPKQTCGGCAFFKPVKSGDSCGHCEVLGGPVGAKGHCVSWTKRA